MEWAAPLIGGAIQTAASAFGQERANRQNREFAAGEALKNRDFQERMSNTAWQRGMDDMRAAGINPMLAIDKGGASTPSGAMGSADMKNVMSELGPSVSNALQARRLKQDLRQSEAQIGLIEAQGRRTDAATALDLERIHELQLRAGLAQDASGAIASAKEGWAGITDLNWGGIGLVKDVGTALGARFRQANAERNARAARRRKHRRETGPVPVAIPRIGPMRRPGG